MSSVLTSTRTRIVAAAAATAAVAGIATSLAVAAHAATARPAAAGEIHTQGVTLAVPATWHLSKTVPGCIVAPGKATPTAGERAYGASTCQLQVITGKALNARTDLNELYFQGDPAVCHVQGKSVGWATTQADTEVQPHATFEHRTFTLPCSSRPAEQWFAAGPPGVLIQRTFADKATERDAQEAVQSAQLPAQRIGVPRSMSGTVSVAHGRTIDVAPVRLDVTADHRFLLNPIWGPTYEFTLAQPSIVYTDVHQNAHDLSVPTYLRYLRSGFPATGNGNGVVSNLNSGNGSTIDRIDVIVAGTS